MNAHDSERLAGLLEAAGYEGSTTPDRRVRRARGRLQHLRRGENADNRLNGNLGHLAPVKAPHPGLQIAVGGCLAQKDRGEILDEPRGRTSSSGPTTSGPPGAARARSAQ